MDTDRPTKVLLYLFVYLFSSIHELYFDLINSSSLGGYSNSASACFVASDGQSLRIYQVILLEVSFSFTMFNKFFSLPPFKAVIDARTLLAQILITPTLGPHNPFNTSLDQEVC